MMGFLTGPAARMDGWLHERLGRPYGIALSVGLVADLVHRVLEAPAHVQGRRHLIGMALVVLLELGLLLHQLAELHERFGSSSGETEKAG